MPLNQQVKETGKVIDFDYQKEIGLLLNSEVRKSILEYRRLLEYLFVLPCFGNVKLQHIQDRTNHGPDPSGMKIWLIKPA